MDGITLSSGTRIPVLGLGVYQTPPGITERVVREAIEVGYRLIDTAQYYRNEAQVGRAVREALSQGMAREDLFLTTKIMASGHEESRRAIAESVAALDLGPIDLMLIHWPQEDGPGTWRALEEAVEAGRVRAIGLSNFYGQDLEEIIRGARIMPAVNQVESSVLYQQRRLMPALDRHGIRLEAWGPLGQGRRGVLDDPVLARVARAHGATPAQVALAFQVRTGVITIPKTVSRDRMVENLGAADIGLSAAELEQLAALDTGRCIGWPGFPEQDYDPADHPFSPPA